MNQLPQQAAAQRAVRLQPKAAKLADYERLSRPATELASHYDAIVVGSGYGGSIAAYHLARAGHRVCLLERGKERLPGQYPNTEREVLAQSRISSSAFDVGSEGALLDVRLGRSIHVISGSGLGGTSQINAGVALAPDPRVFDDPRWPAALRDHRVLAPYLKRAEEMLAARTVDAAGPLPAKTRAHCDAADRMRMPHALVPLTVCFRDGLNRAGVAQSACTFCGDCCSGCNQGAKTTTWMTYLSLAARHGAQIFTELKVSHVERVADGYRVHVRSHGEARRAVGAAVELSAKVVVIAGGALGSTEILLRSQERGLPLSAALGTRFSGNGDMLAFAHGGRPHEDAHEDPARPGPCITASITCAETRTERHSLLQEGMIPAPAARMMAQLLPFLAASDGAVPSAQRRARLVRALLNASRGTPSARTHTLLMIGHDAASGQIRLAGERLDIQAPLRIDDADARHKVAVLRRTARALGGDFVDNPASETLGHAMVTVHPLGGCAMADRAEHGVVNDRGQVFCAAHGDEVHEGLYVCDAAVVPCSLGVNPLLTISALSERIAEAMVARLARHTSSTSVSSASLLQLPGVRFEETLRGPLQLVPGGAWHAHHGSPSLNAVLSLGVRIDNFERFLDDPQHEAQVAGTLDAGALGVLCVHEGSLRLFASDARAQSHPVGLAYQLEARDRVGRHYRIHGRKTFRGGPLRAWHESTTLHVEITPSDQQACVARGTLRISAADVARLLASMEVTASHAAEQRARVTARFVAFFLGQLQSTYSMPYAPSRPEHAGVAVKERALRLPAPELHSISAADGAELSLTRYAAGRRGPVLLAPGFAMSADSFALPTVDENLVEHLVEREFDVWLFDYRSSPKLASAARPYTLDDIAALDWPAAVEHVLRVTAARSVQAVGHCAGSMTLLMALLSGMKGVRSMVSSQLTVHPVSCVANRFKAAVRLPNLLSSLGVRVVPAVSSVEAAVRQAKSAQATDIDHLRLWALFGPTFHAPRVNDATRALLPRYFGATCVHPFEHFSRIIREGRVLDHRGRDTYLPHLHRLALPTLFLAGAHNRLFLPETSRRTWAALRSLHDPVLYERQVFADYGHLDCFIGDEAAADVFPVIASHLERHAA